MPDAFDQLHAAATGTPVPQGDAFDQLHAQTQQPAPVATPSAAPPEKSVGGFVSNIPTSAMKFAGSLYDAGKLAAGAGEKLTNYATGGMQRTATGGELPEEQQFDQVAHQVLHHPLDTAKGIGDYFVQKYGSADKAKQTAYEDPVGFAADLSSVLGGGATALKIASRVGQAAKLGRTADILADVGNVASKASQATNPLTLPGKAVTAIAGNKMTSAARSLYQGALKPNLQNGADANAAITEMGLKEGVPLNSEAPAKTRALVDANQAKTNTLIGNSTAQIDPNAVAATANQDFRTPIASSATPTKDLKQFDAAIQDYLYQHSPGGAPEPNAPTPKFIQPAQVQGTPEVAPRFNQVSPVPQPQPAPPRFIQPPQPTPATPTQQFANVAGIQIPTEAPASPGYRVPAVSSPAAPGQAQPARIPQVTAPRAAPQPANRVPPIFVPGRGEPAPPNPQPYPIQEAQAEKVNTYKKINSYGDQASPDQEANKGLAFGLKTAMEQFIPELKGLNDTEGTAIGLDTAIQRFVAREANGGRLMRFLRPDLASGAAAGAMGATEHSLPAAIGAHLVTKALEDPGVQSRIAIALYKSANNAGTPYIRQAMTPASRIAEVQQHIQDSQQQQQQKPATPAPKAVPNVQPNTATSAPVHPALAGLPQPGQAVSNATAHAQSMMDQLEMLGHHIDAQQRPAGGQRPSALAQQQPPLQ